MLLKSALKNYSHSELCRILDPVAIKIFENIVGYEVKKDQLIHAVVEQYGYEILIEKSQREILIDRLNVESLHLLLLALDIKKESFESLSLENKFLLAKNTSDDHLPRFVEFFEYIYVFDDATALESRSAIRRLDAGYPLYPYQRKLVDRVFSLLKDNDKNRALIHLPTGAGKTRTAINVVCEHLRSNDNGLVLWLANRKELCSQAEDEFSTAWPFLGNRTLKSYSYYDDSDLSLGGVEGGIVFAGLQKLHSVRNSDRYAILYQELSKHVSFIVIDEAHIATAPTYANILGDMVGINESCFVLGLTATPGRSFNLDDDRLAKAFLEQKITMKVVGYASPIEYLQKQDYLAKPEYKLIEYDGVKILSDQKLSSLKDKTAVNAALEADDSRNAELVRIIVEEYEKGKSIIVFACSVNHSRILANLLAFYRVKAFSLDSQADSSSEVRSYKIKEYKDGRVRVLINYGILTAGFDAPITSVAVIARPTDSLVDYSQMGGRAMRGLKSKGNSECTIYTVRDDIPAYLSVLEQFDYWEQHWQEV